MDGCIPVNRQTDMQTDRWPDRQKDKSADTEEFLSSTIALRQT